MEDWLFGSGDANHEDELLLQFTDSCNRWMTVPEERGLYLSFTDLTEGVDPVLLAMVLHKDRLITVSTYNIVMRMFQKRIKRQNICKYLIEQLPSTVSLQNLTNVLDKCGYADLSAKLLFNSFKWNIAYTSVYNPGSSSPSAHRLYSKLKLLVNNAQLHQPTQFLRRLADRCYTTMTLETDPHRKQGLADQCIAIIGAETDTIAITFDKTLCKHVLFNQMEIICRETSNTLISDLVYYGRLANAYAIAGDYNMCTQILHEAKCKAYITGPCMEFVNLAYIIAYVTLWQFERCPTHELRSELLMWGRIGLKCVGEEFVENGNQWRRNFLLRMVLCLLGLSNRSTVIENCPVNEYSIAEAKTLLAEFDKYWNGIEKRREMFYYVARARLCELEHSTSDCGKYLSLAYKLSVKGKFEESKFIYEYYKKLAEDESVIESKGHTLFSRPKKVCITPTERFAKETVQYENEVKEKAYQLHNRHVGFVKTEIQSKDEVGQLTMHSGIRGQPNGSSNVRHCKKMIRNEFRAGFDEGRQQKTTYLPLTKIWTEACQYPSTERFPPDGHSLPDSPVVSENKSYGSNEEIERTFDIETFAKVIADKRIHADDEFQESQSNNEDYPENNHDSPVERGNRNGRRIDKSFRTGFTRDTCYTKEMTAISYASLSISSLVQPCQ